MYTHIHHTSYEPETVRSSNPIACVACGQVWDADEDDAEYTLIDDKPYCAENCADKQNRLKFRAEALGSVAQGIEHTRKLLTGDQTFYPCEIDEPGNPFEILDDFEQRIAKFAIGKDTGFRNDGVMLDYGEFRNLLDTIKAAAQLIGTQAGFQHGPTRQALLAQEQLLYTAHNRTIYGGE